MRIDSYLAFLDSWFSEIEKLGLDVANFPLEDLVKKYPHFSWDTSNIKRPEFPRLKLILANGTELKFNHSPVLKS